MQTKRLPNMSWKEVAIIMAIYLSLFLGVTYIVFTNIENGDNVLEMLKLVHKHEEVRGREPPIDIAQQTHLDASNFDYHYLGSMDGLIGYRN